MVVPGGGAVSYERGTPVCHESVHAYDSATKVSITRFGWQHEGARFAQGVGPLPSREVLYMTLEEHILLRALALGLPNREVLYVTVRSVLTLTS
jgi:hypothetical protein